MFGDIVSGREKSKCVVIEDSVVQSGRPVLISFINSLCQRVEKVHLICYDRSPAYITEHVSQRTRLVVHDGFKDVLGWESPDNLNIATDLVQYLNDHAQSRAHHSVAIVIDSLSPMLLHRPAPHTCQTISRLTAAKIEAAEVEQVICLLHSDLHDDHSLCLVEHVATSVVKICPPTLPQFLLASNVLHKRVSGKVIKVMEHFNLTDTYEITDITEVKSIDKSGITTNQTSQPDPAANLTFNLSLTDKEKAARSQVKLPYVYDQGRQDETLSKSVGEGKIFYQPDEADDFDEEDPDDDLDI